MVTPNACGCSRSSPPSARPQASGTLRARCGTFQAAVKPAAVTCRSSGRNAPAKLGCGQSEASDTRVSRATGATMSETEPLKARSTVKSNGCGGCSGSGSRPAPAPASLAWMPVSWVPGKPMLGAKGMSVAPAILRVAASLRPETPVRPSTNAASRQRTAATSAATSAMRGARKPPRQLQACSIDRHLEDGAPQRLGIGAASNVEHLGGEYGPALLDLLEALVALHRLDAHRVGHHQERPEHALLRAPQLADLAAHARRTVLAFPDEPVDQSQRDEEQNDQEQDQNELERRAAQCAPRRLEQIHSATSVSPGPGCLAAGRGEVAAALYTEVAAGPSAATRAAFPAAS